MDLKSVGSSLISSEVHSCMQISKNTCQQVNLYYGFFLAKGKVGQCEIKFAVKSEYVHLIFNLREISAYVPVINVQTICYVGDIFILALLSVDVDSEKFNLSIETVYEHRTTLYQEMEPSLIADVLLEKLVLNIDEHDTVERAVTRKEKCDALLLLVQTHKDNIQKFKLALKKCGCSSVLDEMKEKVPEIPGI